MGAAPGMGAVIDLGGMEAKEGERGTGAAGGMGAAVGTVRVMVSK